MGVIVSFKELIVWQKSHSFVLKIYALTKDFPRDEMFALTNQVRRAAVSIPANIAEGFKKNSLPNKMNYLSHSEGSLNEVQYYLILAKDLKYITDSDFEHLYAESEEISKLIAGYSKTIKNYHSKK